MKRKVLNLAVTISAWVGVFIIIGAVGHVDYMAEIGQEYPIIKTVFTTLLGFVLCVPAIIRSVFYG